ncbi:MAG: hypothetical protein AAGA77_18025 [Bacteroidota bacterium]
MANKKAKNKSAFTLKEVRNTVKSVNKFILDTTEEVLDSTLERTEDWQLVGEKAIQGGIKVAAKQQDLVFDALEALKKQIKKGKKRAVAITK